ncbi:hypothetical protein [Herbaspirillum lusitanum]|uniref:hypothetical protein n=1 Tax=Herbaspirillum lusitanum TaxID=213312 RepID=UPI0002F1A934|nr:hypothetical protein [Herbaspirillum lusitanum]
MPGFILQKNTAFEWAGSLCRIDRLQPNGEVLIEYVNEGHLTIVSKKQLLVEYSEGRIVAKNVRSDEILERHIFSRPLDELPPEILNAATRRLHYVKAILEHGSPVFTREYLQPLIELAAKQIDDENLPSVTSIYRWCTKYKNGRDIRALIPRFDRRGSRKLKQADTVLQLALASVEEAFAASPKATIPNIYTRLLGKIESENRLLSMSAHLKSPCLRTLYRMFDRLEAYDRVCFRDGKLAADKKFRLVKSGVVTTQILERVEIDHTPLDLFLVDERTWLPLGRPTLTVIIDHYSRMLLGFYLSYGSPSAQAVMGALRHAILPKCPAKMVLPHLNVQHAWPCYGRPDVIF